MEKENMLPNTVEMVQKARELGATIIHAPITFTNDYHELSPHPYGILKGVVDSKSFRKGTWGAEIVEDLTPQEEDISHVLTPDESSGISERTIRPGTRTDQRKRL